MTTCERRALRLYPHYFRNRRPFSRLRGTLGRQLNWIDTQLFGVAR